MIWIQTDNSKYKLNKNTNYLTAKKISQEHTFKVYKTSKIIKNLNRNYNFRNFVFLVTILKVYIPSLYFYFVYILRQLEFEHLSEFLSYKSKRTHHDLVKQNPQEGRKLFCCNVFFYFRDNWQLTVIYGDRTRKFTTDIFKTKSSLLISHFQMDYCRYPFGMYLNRNFL